MFVLFILLIKFTDVYKCKKQCKWKNKIKYLEDYLEYLKN